MKLAEQTRPGQPIPLNLRDKEHGKLVDWAMERVEHSCQIKREVEREALRAFRHLTSTVDLDKHRWPFVTYDPVYYSSVATREAGYAQALWANEPLMDYEPGDDTDWEQAAALSSTVGWHLDRIQPRGRMNEVVQGLETVGTQLIHSFWDYDEQDVWYWKRVPRNVSLPDPVTGQPASMWIDTGEEKLVRTREVVRDSPNFKAVHITQALFDDSDPDIQKGEWVGMTFEISGREARRRCEVGPKWGRWNRQAVEKAIAGETPVQWKWGTVLSNQREWMGEIGLGGSGARSSTASVLSREAEGDLKGLHGIELWRRHKGGIQKLIILGGAYAVLFSWSPFGHGKYPFVLARNYALGGQFFGLSSYRIVRFLIRGIQTFRCAAGTEASFAAMPPMTYPDTMNIIGKRWEPGADWLLQNGTAADIQFLQRSDAGRSIANSEAGSLQQQIDIAMALSNVGRGSSQGNKGTATGDSIAAERGNMREAYLYQNFGYDTLVPLSDQFAGMTCQLNDYGVQVQATGNPKGDPVTIFPEQYRGGNYISTAAPTVVGLQQQHKRRWLELYEIANKYQEPNADRREVFTEVVNSIAPGERDRVIKSLEQVNAEMGKQGMPPIQGEVMQGSSDTVGQAAADLREAYSPG